MSLFQIGVPGRKYGLQPIKPKPGKALSIFAQAASEEDAGGIESVNERLEADQKQKQRHKKHELDKAKALAQDATVFDYDGVFDSIQVSRTTREVQKQAAKVERKSRYVGQLLEKHAFRELEHDIIYERKLLKEREADEHLYGDKEKFVTSAYKEQLQQNKLWLEEEARREAKEVDVTKKGDMSGIFRNYISKLQNGEELPSESKVKQEEKTVKKEEPSVKEEEQQAQEQEQEEEKEKKHSSKSESRSRSRSKSPSQEEPSKRVKKVEESSSEPSERSEPSEPRKSRRPQPEPEPVVPQETEEEKKAREAQEKAEKSKVVLSAKERYLQRKRQQS